jgi:hypothetical protein
MLAQGAWDHAETQGGTPVARRRDLALDLVQAAKAVQGAGSGLA